MYAINIYNTFESSLVICLKKSINKVKTAQCGLKYGNMY